MAINIKCPKCGGTRVQLSNVENKHGCLYFVLFGIYYLAWLVIKWMAGLIIFLCYDWWMALVKAIGGKGHVWQSKRCFSNKRKIYYCHDCGYNFKA